MSRNATLAWLAVLLSVLVLAGMPCRAETQAQTINRLISQLKTDNAEARDQAVYALAEIGTPAVPSLLAIASHPDARVRLGVLKVFYDLPDARAFSVIVAALQDKNADVRCWASLALSKCPHPGRLDAMLAGLKNSDTQVVLSLLQELQTTDDSRIVSPLVDVMRRPDWEQIRCDTIHMMLSNDRFPLPPAQLQAWLTDPQPGVRALAASLLGEKIDPRVGDMLYTALFDASPRVRAAAAGGVARFRNARTPARLRELLADPDPEVRYTAASGLASLRDVQAFPLLIALLDDPDASVRSIVIGALQSYKDPRAAQPIAKRLSDPDRDVRTSAAYALRVLRDPAVVQPLLAAWKAEKDGDVSEEMLDALLQQRDPAVVDVLLRMAESDDPAQSGYALLALSGVQDPRILDLLIEDLQNTALREVAIHGLGNFKDTRAVSALLPLLKDNDGSIRAAVCIALGKIGDAHAIKPIIASFNTQEAVNADQCVAALATLCGDDIPTLAAALGCTHPSYQEELAKILEKRGDPRAVQPLIDTLKRERDERQAMIKRVQKDRQPDMADIIESIEDGSVNPDCALAHALGKLKDARAIPILAETFKDYSSKAQQAAAFALVEIGGPEIAPILLTQAHHADPWLRGLVAQALAMLKDPQGYAAILAAVQDKEPVVRFYACEALGELGNREAVPVLLNRLSDLAVVKDDDFWMYDHEPTVAEAAVLALGQLKDPRACEPLLKLAASRQNPLRITAITGLGSLRDARAVPVLCSLLKDPDETVQREAVITLRTIGDAKAVPALCGLLKDPVNAVSKEAAVALEALVDAQSVEPLIAFLRNNPSQLNAQAMQVLAHVRDPRTADFIYSQLASPYSGVAVQAAQVLGKLGDPRAVEPLILMVITPETAAILGQLKDRRAVPALVDALYAESDSAIPGDAARALAQIGDPAAIPELITILERSPDDDTNRAAFVDALKSLTGQDFGADAAKWRAWREARGK